MVRPTQGSVNRYTADQVPSDVNELPRFLRDEFIRLQNVLSEMANLQLDVTTVAPTKPREGMIRLADGTLFNPGSGRGVYCYSNSAWRFLG